MPFNMFYMSQSVLLWDFLYSEEGAGYAGGVYFQRKSAVSLETLAECMSIMNNNCQTEVIQVFVSKAAEMVKHHLMIGQNPIYIVKGILK